MMKRIANLICVVSALCLSAATYALTVAEKAEMSTGANRTAFNENLGQIHDLNGRPAAEVRYAYQAKGTSIFVLNDGLAYQFARTTYPDGYDEALMNPAPGAGGMARIKALEKQIKTAYFRMDMHLLGANPNTVVVTEGQSADYTMHASRSNSKAYTYTSLRYLEVYPGIDWVVYTTKDGIKYDFELQPGANPDLIQLKFQHQESLYIDEDGRLVQSNRLGRFVEHAPVSCQGAQSIETAFVLKGNVLSFELGAYDASKPLTIDPERVWGTYYGGTDDDRGQGVAEDATGAVYYTGFTNSANNIASGGYQEVIGGSFDAFLVKFDAEGNRLWSTYFGGEGLEQARDCTVDADGNIYVAGRTTSQTNMVLNGHQATFGGGIDVFLTKFASNGELLWSTYYGGAGDDYSFGVSVDSNNDVCLSGFTNSTANIASGGHQNAFGGGTLFDAFLAKFNSSGVRQWATYYGAQGDDYGLNVASDSQNNIYLTGYTTGSPGLASGGIQNSNGGGFDALLVKFNSGGTRLWATYLGSAGTDVGSACVVDDDDNFFFVGYAGGGLPTSSGVPFGGNIADGIIAKFTPAGIPIWSTYLGGEGVDYILDASLGANGNLYTVGYTTSPNNIAFNAYQNNYGGGVFDVFMSSYASDGAKLWGTYYGGSGRDDGLSCSSGGANLYIAGFTGSQQAMVQNAFQPAYGGGIYDGLLAKFEESGCAVQGATTSVLACNEFTWNDITYTIPGTYEAMFTTADGCDSLAVLELDIESLTIDTQPFDFQVESGETAEFSIDYNSNTTEPTFQWQVDLGAGFEDLEDDDTYSGVLTSGLTIFNVTSDFDGFSYRCVVTNPGCDLTSDPATLTVDDPCVTQFSTTTLAACDEYLWNEVTYTESGIYEVILVSAQGCDSIAVLDLDIETLAIDTQPLDVSVEEGTNAVFTLAFSSSSAATEFQWQGDFGGGFADLDNDATYSGVLTSTLTVSNVTPEFIGYSYRCLLSNPGCSLESGSATLDVSLSTFAITGIEFTVFPNPAYAWVEIRRADATPANYRIFDISGRAVISGLLNAGQQRVDLSALPGGIYLLQVDNTSTMVKLFKL